MLPFLHWMPQKIRPFYARFSPRSRHLHEAKKTYQNTNENNKELTITEIPSCRTVIDLASRNFSIIEDITGEFLEHPLMQKSLGKLKSGIAGMLINSWICPERKLLLRK